MWDLIDMIYVLSVIDSPRISIMKDRLSLWNIPDNKLKWNIVPRLNCNNCLMCSAVENHILAYRDAYKNSYNNILIFEDDAVVKGDTSDEVLENIAMIEYKTDYFLKKYSDYHILYLGNVPFNIDHNYYDNGIIKSMGSCIHAYLINYELFSRFINIDIKLMIDIRTPLLQPLLDYWIYFIECREKKSYALYPMLVFQDNIPQFKILGFDFKKLCNKNFFQKFTSTSEYMLYNKKEIILIIILFIINIIINN